MNNLHVLLVVFTAIYSLANTNIANAQRKHASKPYPVTGSEQVIVKPSEKDFKINTQYRIQLDPVVTRSGTVLFSSTSTSTVYDLQSNGVPQQIWQDPIMPANVHAVFMYSLVPGFATRGCAYLFSSDFGATWTRMGDVPSTARSGFPAISGLVSGAAVVANQNTTNGTNQRTKIYYDQGAGFGSFTEIDPGVSAEGDPIWPRLICLPNSNVSFAASTNGLFYSYTNKSTNIAPPGTFSGYQTYPGDQAETYSLALAPNGTVGHAFIGSDDADPNDVFYRSSADGGLTWTPKQRIWDWNVNIDSIGCYRGVSMVFGNNNQPYVSFNTSLLSPSGYFPEKPSQIRVWSPAISGGVPVIVASQNNVPFYPNQGQTTDAFLPLCRPAIGRSSTGNGIVVAFNATTDRVGTDFSRYYSVWTTYSVDNGNSWNHPDKITPDTPLRDWRFVSVSPTNHVSVDWTIQMVCQSDSLAGSHVNGAPMGRGELVGIRYIPFAQVTPFTPTLVSPQNGSQNVVTTTMLDWNSAALSEFYQVHVSIDSLFGSLIINQSNIIPTQYQIDTLVLNHDTKYYWRARGVNFNGPGLWSFTWSFRTISSFPVPPVLSSPANGAINLLLTPLLDWQDVINANTYRAQISRDSNFTSTVFDQSGIAQSQISVPSSILNYDTTYYWRISGQNSFGYGQWSTVWNFTTMQIPPPLPPALIVPANNANNVSLTPDLDWHKSSNAVFYRVNIATDLNFNNIAFDKDSIVLSSYSVPPDILNVNTLYFWRVNANNLGGTSNWSTTFVFRTVVTGINQIGTNIPERYELFNNYPNPFNPVTKIRFDLPKSSLVRILLYDITGRSLMNLAEGIFQAGSYETVLDARSLASGVYFYRMDTPEFSKIKSMVLIK